ncbi:MAG TPA: response regulator transcription factor [Puia sp.]|nr:response regulator transcription factor [Puia sp.]
MDTEDSIRIALVEDNAVNRNTFFQKIESHPEWKIAFVSTDGTECLAELKGTPFHLLPDVIFVDIEMPKLNGIQTIAIAKAIYPHIHFIILTVFDDDEKIFEAIKAGASGYLLKHESHELIFDAINSVLHQGGALMSPAIARKTFQMLVRSPAEQKNKESNMPDVITEREKEILQYTINGYDAKHIATALNISVLTVRKHIANIYEKLQVQSKAQVMQIAHKNNWFKT